MIGASKIMIVEAVKKNVKIGHEFELLAAGFKQLTIFDGLFA